MMMLLVALIAPDSPGGPDGSGGPDGPGGPVCQDVFYNAWSDFCCPDCFKTIPMLSKLFGDIKTHNILSREALHTFLVCCER